MFRFGFQRLPVLLLVIFSAVAVKAQDDDTKKPAPAAGATPAPASPAPAPAQPTPTAAPSPREEKSPDVVTLSPFEVHGEKARGYFAPNTLAGTRMNNNIADLPSSVTVVTQQQMEDTNSTNINDVFRYETNTEGAHGYTPFTLVRSNVQDALGGGGGTTGNFTSAVTTGNRVRGLATVDQEEDNFFSHLYPHSLRRLQYPGGRNPARGPTPSSSARAAPAGHCQPGAHPRPTRIRRAPSWCSAGAVMARFARPSGSMPP